MKKGFVFSLDVFFAALIITYFVTTFPSQQQGSSFDELALLVRGQDALSTIALESNNESLINESLQELVPEAYLKVDYYLPNHSLNHSITIGEEPDQSFVKAERLFVTTNSGNITLLGVAEVRLE